MEHRPFNHTRRGSGEALLLLHGIGHHLQGWDPIVPLLEDAFELWALDLPGFGRSAPLPTGDPLTIPSYTDAVARWLAEQGLERPHVAGNSMGGAIALELARRGLVRSACAISPAGFWTEGERSWCQGVLRPLQLVPAPLRPALRRLAGTPAGRQTLFGLLFAKPRRMPGPVAQFMLDDAWASPSFAAALQAFDAYECERFEPDLPVTVAWGTRDLLLPYRRQAPRARERISGAGHLSLPGLGHTPMWDDPGRVAHTIRAAATR